jgi:hypothetical protein
MTKIVGTRITNMHFYKRMYIMTFESDNSMLELQCSAHLRVIRDNKIVLTYGDVWIGKTTKMPMSNYLYGLDSWFEKTYASVAIEAFMKGVDGYKVTSVEYKPFGDMLIFFENGDVIETIDYMHSEGIELYRLIDKTNNNLQYVVTVHNDEIYFEIQTTEVSKEETYDR